MLKSKHKKSKEINDKMKESRRQYNRNSLERNNCDSGKRSPVRNTNLPRSGSFTPAVTPSKLSRRGSIDTGSMTAILNHTGRRSSVDYGNDVVVGHARWRRSSVDIEKQKELYDELQKRKHIQTVKEQRELKRMQSAATHRLTRGLSKINLNDITTELPKKTREKPMKIDECLTKDPNLREDQVKVILQSFSTLDENGDGKISKREIARAYRLAGFNPTKKEVDDIVLEHDDNDDGYIDFDEYFSVISTKMIQMDFEKERLKTAFKVLDADQDGFITREELRHALSATGDKFTEDEITEIIQRADRNLDGKIDYTEFVEAELCKSVF